MNLEHLDKKIIRDLKEYVQHTIDCGTRYGYYQADGSMFWSKCDCGLDKLLESINE